MSSTSEPTDPAPAGFAVDLPEPSALPGIDSPLSLVKGGPGLVYQRLITLKRAVRPLAKDRDFEGRNRAGLSVVKYKFRGIDDVYDHLHAHLADFGLLLVPRETTEVKRAIYETGTGSRANHVALVMRYEWIAEDGSTYPVQVPGEGMDNGDKATGKALSGSHKYALIQTLALPTGDPDGDFFDTEGTPAPSAPARAERDQGPVSGGNPGPTAPLSHTERVPFTSVDEARKLIDQATPDTVGALRRRVFDSVNNRNISTTDANDLMARLDAKGKTHG